MATFGEALRGAIKTGLCNYLGDVEKGADFVGSIYPVNPGPAARAIRRPVCDNSDPTEPPPPYEGGQCTDKEYDLYLPYTRASEYGDPPGQGNPRIASNRPGPITGFKVTDVVQENGGQFPQWSFFWTFSDRDGTYSGVRDNQLGDSPSTEVETSDGSPDDCGNPGYQPNPFPPGGVSIPLTINYTNNEGDDVTELGDFNLFAPVFAPIVAPVTTIYAPIRVNLPDINFDGTIELAPDFEINLSPSGGDKSPGSPSGPDGPVQPDTSDDTDEDASNRQLAGVFVRSQFTDDIRATELYKDGGPVLFVPRIATLHFRVREAGRTAWLGPFDVKTTDTYIPVPPDVFGIGWVAQNEPGVSSVVTGVYKLTVDSLTA